MKDDEFERLMRDAAHTYRPRPALDDDATWRAIDQALPGATADRPPLAVVRGDASPAHRGARLWRHPLARMAAMLLVGVAVGRASVDLGGAPSRVERAEILAATSPAPLTSDSPAPAAVDPATGEYLARTEALLAMLPAELRASRTDAAFVGQADALLLQTRLLLDSPAAADPALRALLDDLEVVLAQVVRLDARRDPMKVDFLQQAMQQRDVLPRLRDAVVDRSAD